MATLAQKLRHSKLIDWGFCKNQWLWFHLFASTILTKLLLFFQVSTVLFVFKYVPISIATVINMVVAILLWELIEFFVENKGKWSNVEKNYGSVEKWKYDTIGDILGAVFIVLIDLAFYITLL